VRPLTERHPTEGTLRRLLDEPAGVPDDDRAHVARCPECLAGLATAGQDAGTAAAALACAVDPDVDLAWRRLTARVAAGAPGRAAASARARTRAPSRRWSGRLRSPVVALLGVVVVLGGAGAAAAADWLPIFRTEHVAAVPLTSKDLVGLPDLSAYGELAVVTEPDVHQVAGAAAAREVSGLDAPRVDTLPAGVTGTPAWTVGGQAVAEFTFSADRAAAAAAAAGTTLPPPPAGLDGSRFRLVAGPGVAEVWSEARGVPALVVARVTAPSVYSSGVPFTTARDYLLSLPGLPAGLAAQLRSLTGEGTTLPLPVPAELVRSSTADVGGHEATVLTSRDGTITGAVWVADGVVTGVAGTLTEDEVLTVARALR
jgi:hypothetical protein